MTTSSVDPGDPPIKPTSKPTSTTAGSTLLLPFRTSRRTQETFHSNSMSLNGDDGDDVNGNNNNNNNSKQHCGGIETVPSDDSGCVTVGVRNARSRWRRSQQQRRSTMTNTDTTTTTTTAAALRGRPSVSPLIREFGPKLILEVMGGAGAVWGFSEICGLRTPSTLWFWRPVAATIGFLFLLRLLKQLSTAWIDQSTALVHSSRNHHYHDHRHEQLQKHHQHPQQHYNNDLELAIEMAPSTCSTDSNSYLVDSQCSPSTTLSSVQNQPSASPSPMPASTTMTLLDRPLSPNEWTALTSSSTVLPSQNTTTTTVFSKSLIHHRAVTQ